MSISARSLIVSWYNSWKMMQINLLVELTCMHLYFIIYLQMGAQGLFVQLNAQGDHPQS